MPRRTMVEAIRDAMDVAMQRDDNVVVFGLGDTSQRDAETLQRADAIMVHVALQVTVKELVVAQLIRRDVLAPPPVRD